MSTGHLDAAEAAARATPKADPGPVASLARGLFGSSDSWPQFHGGGPNAGVALRHTAPALQPVWRRDIGDVLASSPVVDEQGFIYVGTANGRVRRVTPDGSATRSVDLGQPIYAPVAVAGDGSVYAVTHRNLDVDTEEVMSFRSTLVKLDSSLAEKWSVDLPEEMVTLAAPKLWEPEGGEAFVFLHVGNPFVNELLVFDASGRRRTSSGPRRCTRPIEGGTGIFGFLDAVWDAMWLDAPPPAGPRVPPPMPTPAVVDYPNVVDAGRALVVTSDSVCAIRAFDFDGARLVERWGRGHSLDVLHASPAVLAGGLLVIGDDDGNVVGLDVGSGAELWRYDAGESVMGTAASFVRPIFVIGNNHIHAVDANGALMDKRSFEHSSVASAAVSGDWVYVAASQELVSYGLAHLSDSAHDRDFVGGLLTPAIGPDGTVYAIHDHRELWAYSPPG